ncbi:hypothetical protein [Paraburkholderia sp. RL17-337-BIB-A]|uniref:hypothetical protein n=1 Tax=Paraburkholderia sp. RL17-337-BIB-A TaxID=3031636 RepID=UPI0038BCBDB6
MTVETLAIQCVCKRVSRIGLGGARAICERKWRGTSEKQSIAVMRRPIDLFAQDTFGGSVLALAVR